MFDSVYFFYIENELFFKNLLKTFWRFYVLFGDRINEENVKYWLKNEFYVWSFKCGKCLEN